VFGKSPSVDFRANFLPCKEVRVRHNGLMQVSTTRQGGKFSGKRPEWIYQTPPRVNIEDILHPYGYDGKGLRKYDFQHREICKGVGL